MAIINNAHGRMNPSNSSRESAESGKVLERRGSHRTPLEALKKNIAVMLKPKNPSENPYGQNKTPLKTQAFFATFFISDFAQKSVKTQLSDNFLSYGRFFLNYKLFSQL